MNQSPQVEHARVAAGAYVEAIEIPAYDAAAVASRMNRRASRRAMPGWAVAAVCILFVAFVAGSPSVRAQVEHMLQGFAVINGQNVPVAVNSVSLEQARRDMPFAVIAPAAIPPGMTEAIDELNPSSSRLDSRLIFRFSYGNREPGLTIVERSARAMAPQQMRLRMTQGLHGVLPPAPPLPNAATRENFFAQLGPDGKVTRQIRLEPISWLVRGTRIDLVSPPGFLSNAQITAIRRAMSL